MSAISQSPAAALPPCELSAVSRGRILASSALLSLAAIAQLVLDFSERAELSLSSSRSDLAACYCGGSALLAACAVVPASHYRAILSSTTWLITTILGLASESTILIGSPTGSNIFVWASIVASLHLSGAACIFINSSISIRRQILRKPTWRNSTESCGDCESSPLVIESSSHSPIPYCDFDENASEDETSLLLPNPVTTPEIPTPAIGLYPSYTVVDRIDWRVGYEFEKDENAVYIDADDDEGRAWMRSEGRLRRDSPEILAPLKVTITKEVMMTYS